MTGFYMEDDGDEDATPLDVSSRRELLKHLLDEAEKQQASRMVEISERVTRLQDMSKQYMMNQMFQFMQQQLEHQGLGQASSLGTCRAKESEEEELRRLAELDGRIKSVEKKLKSITKQLQNSLREKDELRLKLTDIESKLLFLQGESLARQMLKTTPTERDIWQLDKLKRIAAERAKYCKNLTELDKRDRVINQTMLRTEDLLAGTPIASSGGSGRKQVVFNEDTLKVEDESSGELIVATPEEMEAIAKELYNAGEVAEPDFGNDPEEEDEIGET